MNEKVIKIDDNCYKYGYITWTRDRLIDTLSNKEFNVIQNIVAYIYIIYIW